MCTTDDAACSPNVVFVAGRRLRLTAIDPDSEVCSALHRAPMAVGMLLSGIACEPAGAMQVRGHALGFAWCPHLGTCALPLDLTGGERQVSGLGHDTVLAMLRQAGRPLKLTFECGKALPPPAPLPRSSTGVRRVSAAFPVA